MAIQLKELISSLINVQSDWQISLLENWEKIVGYLSKYTYICSIKNDTLFLGVFESVWMHELFLMSGNLISSINDFLGSEKIKHVRFKLVPKRTAKKVKEEIIVSFDKPKIQLKLTDTQTLALSSIKDEDLRKSLVSFLERSLQN
jgi:hypothetical protein